MRLQHVSIPRPVGEASRQEAVDFYCGVLGLQPKPVPASLDELQVQWFAAGEGELELHLFAADDLKLVDEHDRRKVEQHFCLVVDDLAALQAKVEAAGIATWGGPNIYGRPRFFCQDPFGNIVEVAAIEEDYRKGDL